MKTRYFIFIVLLLAPSIFADIIQMRNGQEINDAVVIEINDKEVKYKVGERQVVYTVKKSEIVSITYNDGGKDVFESKQNQSAWDQNTQAQYVPPYENFETGYRIATWALNQFAFPGSGSIVVMEDWTGAIVQWALIGGGIVLIYNGVDSFNNSNDDLIAAGFGMILSSFVYNIYRSATYDKPKPKYLTHSKYGDLNMALLPNKHGKVNAYLMYNKVF
jgi:hypothetical protein